MKYSIKDFSSKPRICSHLLKKSLLENFIFCAVKWLHHHHHNKSSFETKREEWYWQRLSKLLNKFNDGNPQEAGWFVRVLSDQKSSHGLHKCQPQRVFWKILLQICE